MQIQSSQVFPGTERLFALVDCNNFYVSCERAFNPALKNRPVVVMSNNDGCAVARSEEAKALGVQMGVPIFQIRGLIERHGIVLLSSNYTLYGDMSRRVMEVLRGFTARTEIYSIDESFLDLTELKDLRGRDLGKLAEEMRERVERWTGIPVSVGIAPTKTLAKLANRMAKKSRQTPGCCVLNGAGDIREALGRFPLEDVWGIGPARLAWLRGQGVQNALDFTAMADHVIRKRMNVTGLRMLHELRGQSCIELERKSPQSQEIVVSRAFGERLEQWRDIHEATAFFITRAAEKLRARNLVAGHITVFLRTDPFQKNEPGYGNLTQMDFPQTTDDTGEILYYGLKLMELLYKSGYKFKKCGVMLSELRVPEETQLDLFSGRDGDRSKRLMDVITEINGRFGRDKIAYGPVALARGKFRIRFDKRSPGYTTRWADIPRALAL